MNKDTGCLTQKEYDDIKFFIENESEERITNFLFCILNYKGKSINEDLDYLFKYRLLSMKIKL